MFVESYKDKKVLVTGHTGFKGAWLTTWLLSLGAEVIGFSVDIPTTPSLFEVLKLQDRIQHYMGDVTDLTNLQQVFNKEQPDMVFHLAAQSLVAKSYRDPHLTFNTNALGTLNILECVRQSNAVKAAVLVTSDKAYRNVEWAYGYREDDVLGGEDPYSGSKGCAELIAYSYAQSFFKSENTANIATARAGNVIGGGDWAENRIIPDCIRAWSQNIAVEIRNPKATRPWQHVLEPLSGYLWLCAQLLESDSKFNCEAYNFGPDAANEIDVGSLIKKLQTYWPGSRAIQKDISYGAEANLLKLCCDKALRQLKWQPTLSFDQTILFTSEWYQQYYNSHGDLFDFTMQQIDRYVGYAKQKGLLWQLSPQLIPA